MSADFPEPDWKVLRQLHPIALERFCDRVLDEAQDILSNPAPTALERYRALDSLLDRRDRGLAQAFDDLRRSTAFLRLLSLRSRSLLTDDEFSRFSPETQARITSALSS